MGRRSNGEGSIAKRKDGRWSAAYTVGGKRKYVCGKTRKEVATKPREALTEQDKGNYYLHKALKQAVRWRLVPTNVTEGATPPKVSRREITVLSPDQVKIFFEAIRGHRLEAMFVLATTAGIRVCFKAC